MPGTPERRRRRRLIDAAILEAAVRGVDPSTLLDPRDQAFEADLWRFVLYVVGRLGLGLPRRGHELVGACTACGVASLTVGRVRTRCVECGLGVDSLDWLRMQLDRHLETVRLDAIRRR